MGESELTPIHEIVPVGPLRFVLVHYHIFKNAGSTLEYVLHRAFTDRYRTIDGESPDSVLTGIELAEYLSANPDVLALSSHHLKYPVPRVPRTAIIDCCFLRDPLQRVWSMHRYFQRAPPNDELSRLARTSDLRTFVAMLVREHPQMINDVQVNLLANGGIYFRPPNRHDFETACHVLDQIAVLGVVDLFDESLTAAEYYVRPVFPIELQYVRQNTSESDGDTSVSPTNRFRELIGFRLYEELMLLNTFDCELLERAKKEVMRRFRMIPRCDERLADFERRCQVLREAHEELLLKAAFIQA